MRKYNFEPGLIKTIKEADDGHGCFSNTKVQVNYDPATGKVWGDWVIGNDRVAYRDDGIITVGRYAGKVTRAAIIADIEEIEAEYDGLQNLTQYELDTIYGD